MSGRNGLAVMPGRARVLHVVPKTITYTVERADGETVALAGYCKGPSCPVPVAIEVERAWADWEAVQPDADARATMKPHAYLAAVNGAERMLRRDLLIAVILGLDMDAANVLAADDGEWEAILAELGWWTVSAAEDGADPEATAPAETTTNAAPTGAASSPEQPQPIQASIS